MTNKEIRRRAWELCREKFGLILSATFLLSLITSLTTSLVASMQMPMLGLFAAIFLGVITVIASIGMVRFILDIWHGETPRLSVLFSMKHRFWTYIGYMLLMSLICISLYVGILLMTSIIGMLTMPISQSLFQIFLLCMLVLSFVLILWFVLRFEMALVCMVIRRTGGAVQCMRIAWRASKGNVWRLLCNGFVLYMPMFIAQGLLMGYQLHLTMTGQMLNAVGSLLLDFGSILISALLSGYIYLGTYSLHEQLLEQYFTANPQLRALEAFDNLFENAPKSDDSFEEEDEYEDIPEDEEKPQE